MITTGAHPRYEGPRDHPRHIMHVKSKLTSWLANCDTQPIIDQDMVALQKYVSNYACKGASTTEDLIHIWKHLLNTVSDQTSVRSLAQRLLLKTVGMIDVPAAAADFLNSGGHLYHCTRRFRRIGLSGFRPLSTDGKDGLATKKTAIDQFLNEERRVENLNIALYDWAQICNCRPNCGSDHTPVFTGLPMKPVWPHCEDYAKGQLMMFSPGTWTTCEDLKGSHETYSAALADFLSSEHCSEVLIEVLEQAKKKYDEKLKKGSRNYNNQIYQSQNTNNSQSSSQYTDSQQSVDFDLDLGAALMRDMAKENIADVNEPLTEIDLPNGGPNMDWHEYAIQCFGSIWPANTNKWLASVANEAEQRELTKSEECTLPTVNLLLANPLQRVIISVNLRRLLLIAKGTLPSDSEPLCVLIQGTAGVGKTFVIKALSLITRCLFNRNTSVMNLAPTGSASILLPDGCIVHSTTSKKYKTKRFG